MQLTEAHERCRGSLIWSISQLRGSVTPSQVNQLEKIAELIIQTMTGAWRFFHTPEHIFEVGGSQDPLEVLAALFHDMVYVQVDQGIPLNISSYITPFVQEVKGQLMVRPSEDLPEDHIFHLVAKIFGFTPSQILSPFAGQNEFLSGVIAAKCLYPFLDKSVLTEIIACIEATIPFRPVQPSGLTSNDILYQRLIGVNEDERFGWNEEKILEVVKRSVRLANRDVENFAAPNSANFLDNTWNLMPETNHELGKPNSYTVSGYRISMQKMEGFLSFLKPELVFQKFHGEPPDEVYDEMIRQTQKNLEVARLYLGVKLVTIAILEALSYRLGQTIPLSTMMGELPIPGVITPTLEQFLPEVETHYPPENGIELEVLELLSKGRTQDSPYDIKNSPVATFLIKVVGYQDIRRLLSICKEFFNGKLSPEQFLCHCNPHVTNTIISAVLKLFESRAIALRDGSPLFNAVKQ